MRDSEEHHEWGTFWSWAFLLGLSASLFLVMFVLMMIPEVPRQWDFGTLPFTPSETIYSTGDPDPVPTGRMMEAVP